MLGFSSVEAVAAYSVILFCHGWLLWNMLLLQCTFVLVCFESGIVGLSCDTTFFSCCTAEGLALEICEYECARQMPCCERL